MAGNPPVKLSTKGRFAALIIGLVCLALLSEGLLRIGMPNWRDFHNGRFMTLIQVPGYGQLRLGRPGFKGYYAQNNGDFRVHINVNDFGLRNPEPVDTAGGQIWTMGDSMTFGFGVERQETYAERLESLLKTGVYNFAGPGNDVCGYQIMASRIPANLNPRAVILGLFLENDTRPYDCKARFERDGQKTAKPDAGLGLNLQSVKVLLREYTALYNFLTVSLKHIDVVNEALVAVGLVESNRAERAHPDATRTPDLAARVAGEIATLRARYPETPFAVLMIPARLEVRDGGGYYRDLRTAVSAAIEAQGIPVIDPFEALARAGFRQVHFTHDGHWAAKGHDIAARAIARWLGGQGIGDK